MISIGSNVKDLYGVGEKKAALLSKLGIYTVDDLIRYFPRAYQNRGNVKTLLEAEECGETSSMLVTVATEPKISTLKNRKTVLKFSVFDESGKCEVIYFNQNYLKNVFKVGESYRLWGKVVRHRNSKSEIPAPEYEEARDSSLLPDLLPVYPLTKGIGQKAMRALILGAIYEIKDSIVSVIPERIREKYSLTDAFSAFMAIHSPRTFGAISKGNEYFAFEELYLFAISVGISKKERVNSKAQALKIPKDEFKKFINEVGYEPTNAQKRVINEIASDLAKPFSMHRLVMGDVGSGKTLCAAAAAYICIKSGYQCSLMAPTEILANQHYESLSGLFAKFGIETVLIKGSLSKKEKNEAYSKIESGDAMLVIGTHAIFSDGVKFKNPALSICDEQHRFGVNQRMKLSEKSGMMHSLVMSATPIPRTLALAIYGDLDISYLDELPPGRKKVSTYSVNESYRERLNAFIEKQVNEGRQVYIVCPSIEKVDDDEDAMLIDANGDRVMPMKDAVGYTSKLRERLPNIKIGYVHGKMSANEKDAVMSEFVSGTLSVLVSTTVIEVGVNVPNATLMIIENAERFGLSTLHQLRGRVGRGKYESYCILVSDLESESSKSRLKALCDSNDGFKIAQKDLEQRGPGDFFSGNGSFRQHGEASFRVASLLRDMELFRRAFDSASETLEFDPALSLEENKNLKNALGSFIQKNSGSIS